MSLKLIALLVVTSTATIVAEPANIIRAPGVNYSYLDNNGQEIAPDKLQDPERKFLSDGIRNGENGAKSVHRFAQDKKIRVLFRFPVAVMVDKAAFIWMHAYNSRQWFDKATIYAGNSLDTLKELGSTGCPGGVARETYVEIPFKPTSATLFLLDIEQKTDPKHAMIIINEVMLFGSDSQIEKIESAASHHLKMEISRHYPSNIFPSGSAANFTVKLSGIKDGNTIINTQVTDYFGNISDQDRIVLAPGINTAQLVYKSLPNGYYRLKIDAETINIDKSTVKGNATADFILAPLVKRSAAEALKSGNRFGVTGHHSTAESRMAPTLLGLSWNNFLLTWAPNTGNDPEHLDFSKERERVKVFCSDIPANNFIQIKSTPIWCYDKKRFGEPSHEWSLKMPTNKDAFQRFIREQVKLIPQDQKLVKVWNEPWDTYTAEDYATLCCWIGEAVKQVRPDIMVGPNIVPMAYMEKFIGHGGMKFMDMLIVHPYSADFTSTPEAAGLRMRLRAWKNLLKEKTGRDYPIYVTEIGWPTPETGPNRNTEEQQAYCIARAGLNLFAEDVKAVTFFCNGSPEQIKDYREHYFGFFHNNSEPKPVLAAAATMNRMIEGCSFLGDLGLGPDIGAMLFKRPDEKYMLALYADGNSRKIFIRPFAEKLKIVDIVGKEQELTINENRLSLTLDGNPVYLVGVGHELLDKVISPMKIKWSNEYQRTERDCHYSPTKPDANFWAKLPLWKISAPDVPEKHLSATWQAAWNENNLFLNIQVTDKQPGINFADGEDAWQGDCIELFISTAPDNAIPGFLKDADHQILISPFSKSGKAVALYADISRKGKPVNALQSSYKVGKDSWSVELSIPRSSLSFNASESSRMAMDIIIDDICMDHSKGRISISSNGRKDNHINSSVWTILNLKANK